MKIGLNGICVNNRPSGAKQRFVGIYGELFNCMPDTEFVIYEPIDCRITSWFEGTPNVFSRQTMIPSEGRVEKLIEGLRYWRGALAPENFDFFEGFHIPLVKAPTGKTVLTIHDIRGLNQDSGSVSRALYKFVLGRSIQSADHVVTVSDSMKAQILKLFPDVPITVIYNGLDANKFDTIEESAMQVVRQKFLLPEQFALAVGHFEVRKNYLRLIDTVALLRDRGRPCPLVIIGNDSGERKAIEARIASLNLSGTVQILSGLSDLEIRCAYMLCSLFVFPSSYEGFGIPVLEAMAAGCPMVLSDIPVFREITESRGVYFSDNDTEAMAFAMEMVLTSKSERDRQIKYGKDRVQAFNFKNLAGQLSSLYRVMQSG